MFLDSHCHLDDPAFDDDRGEVIGRALDAGLRYLLTVGTDLESARRALELAERHERVYAAAAVHPHDAAGADEATLERFEPLYGHPKMIGVGETGLDFYRDRSPREAQEEVFRHFLRLARRLRMPAIFHLRDPKEGPPLARQRFLQILDEETVEAGALRGVVHCYTGPLEFAVECLRRGLLISIPGVVTFKQAGELRRTVRRLPYESLLVETDAPYLAPAPKRGGRNEPAFVAHTAAAVAELRGIAPRDLDRILLRNFETLFGLREPQRQGEIAYRIRDNLYLNLTNRCTCACTFCRRTGSATVSGYYLGLDQEPSAAELLAAAGDPAGYRQVVFCGYGEPTVRLRVLKEVAAGLQGKGAAIRLNTNGHAELIHGRDVLPELVGLVDLISVSLNAASAEEYVRLCRPRWGDETFEAVQGFIRRAIELGFDVTATAVELPGLDLEAVRGLAENLGAKFRPRFYNVVG